MTIYITHICNHQNRSKERRRAAVAVLRPGRRVGPYDHVLSLRERSRSLLGAARSAAPGTLRILAL